MLTLRPAADRLAGRRGSESGHAARHADGNAAVHIAAVCPPRNPFSGRPGGPGPGPGPGSLVRGRVHVRPRNRSPVRLAAVARRSPALDTGQLEPVVLCRSRVSPRSHSQATAMAAVRRRGRLDGFVWTKREGAGAGFTMTASHDIFPFFISNFDSLFPFCAGLLSGCSWWC